MPQILQLSPEIIKLQKEVSALENHSGSADSVTVCEYVWKYYEMDFRKSGDFFYTWQYDIRWAAINLRQS